MRYELEIGRTRIDQRRLPQVLRHSQALGEELINVLRSVSPEEGMLTESDDGRGWAVFSSHSPENVGELIALKASADMRTNNGLSLADLACTRTIFRDAMLEVLPLHVRRLPPVIVEDGPLSIDIN